MKPALQSFGLSRYTCHPVPWLNNFTMASKHGIKNIMLYIVIVVPVLFQLCY